VLDQSTALIDSILAFLSTVAYTPLIVQKHLCCLFVACQVNIFAAPISIYAVKVKLTIIVKATYVLGTY
jgi:hypothetical protein